MVNPSECIVLDDREYLCFDKIDLDDKQYLALITVDEPTEICFAEESTDKDGESQVRLIGHRETKQKIAAALQAKIEASTANSENN